ncbi:MAG: hypothetical protein HYR80_00330 [Nitrospirae bacterium]|nr:hypothetical protein [Nitrospirota bacterium]MBI3803506.1 hypothetical protein [Candidatus Manganitrophaceae bacterium]
MARSEGLILTDRDMDLLKYLAFGPAFADDLHTRFFIGKGKLVSRQAFERRMWKLMEGYCIQRMEPQRIRGRRPILHKPVYSLAEGGIEVLTSQSVLQIDRIRRVRPTRQTLFHEITLTRFIRRIYEGDPRRYQVMRLYDHDMLAKQVQRVRIKRIPDLRFTLKFKHGAYFSYLVEVDAGTTHTPEFVQKLVAFMQLNRRLAPVNSKDPVGILIVCHTADRMETLQRAVVESHITAKVANRFLFSTIQNIDNSLGLYNPWYKADGAKIDLIFKDGTKAHES